MLAILLKQSKYLTRVSKDLKNMSKSNKNLNTGSDRKKTFNKKKWREEKYSIKAKVKRWEENRKKTLMSKYHKELKKSGICPKKNHQGWTKDSDITALKKAQFKYQRLQEEKQRKMEEKERIKKEKSEALKAYREKKTARFIKLSQKTRKGQPLMKGRIELLLEKIEKTYGS